MSTTTSNTLSGLHNVNVSTKILHVMLLTFCPSVFVGSEQSGNVICYYFRKYYCVLNSYEKGSLVG